MKGQNTFTTSQIDEIKRLIADKVEATPYKQKGIRAKIRKLGFHYSDFSSKKDGYTVADFEALIRSGQIKVIGGNYNPTEQQTTKSIAKIKPATTKVCQTSKTYDLTFLLQTFKQNRFDPTNDSETIIPDQSGNYILCLKSNSNLPTVSVIPNLTSFDGLKTIYTGIAGGSLRSRDYCQHFKGSNAGRSTLRKSLGVMFGYKQIPRDKDPSNGKTKFGQADEEKLTKWMCDNLIMYFLPTTDFDSIEIKLINHFNPPLNLKDNHNSINADYRKLLSVLRSKK
jgi:hypothetical protein